MSTKVPYLKRPGIIPHVPKTIVLKTATDAFRVKKKYGKAAKITLKDAKGRTTTNPILAKKAELKKISVEDAEIALYGSNAESRQGAVPKKAQTFMSNEKYKQISEDIEDDQRTISEIDNERKSDPNFFKKYWGDKEIYDKARADLLLKRKLSKTRFQTWIDEAQSEKYLEHIREYEPLF